MTRPLRALPLRLALGLALGLTLAACELRDTAVGDESEPAASDDPLATLDEPAEPGIEPEATQSPSASIIRDDARVEQDEFEFPAQPLEVTIPFGDSGNDLTEEAERLLSGVLESEALEEGWPVILRGHTDSSGNDSANLRASRARAEAVAAWLVERGVDDERIEVIAFGEQNPIAPNARPDGTPDEEGRARNRRVDIEIAMPDTGEDSEDEDADSADGA